MSKFTFIDLFSGIGGFRLGLEALGGVCLGYSEIDKHAINTYRKNFGDCNPLGDLTELQQLPDVDLIVGGVPCQPWSNAGLQKGFADERGKLWYNVIQLIAKNKPKAFIFENVKGLMDKRHEESFQYILKAFTHYGYNVSAKLINTYEFTGVPQNRNRAFIVGVRGLNIYDFPSNYDSEPDRYSGKLANIFDELAGVPINYLCNNPSDIVYFTDTKVSSLVINSWDLTQVTDQERSLLTTVQKLRRRKAITGKDGGFVPIEVLSTYNPDFTMEDVNHLIDLNMLRINSEGDKLELKNSRDIAGINGISRIVLPTSPTFPTLTARGGLDFMATVPVYGYLVDRLKAEFLSKVYHPGNYISLNSTHYKRLQGFPETFQVDDNERLAKKQLGNAVSVPVITKLGRSLLKNL